MLHNFNSYVELYRLHVPGGVKAAAAWRLGKICETENESLV
jgi:hypothetical protein